MARIVTVNGLIAPEQLGRMLMHEHVICDFYRVTGILNQLLNDEALAIAELALLADAGGAGLVECTTPDFGRDPAALQRIATATGLHIVAGTGWYRELFYPPEIDRLPVEALAEQMVAELTDGMEGTTIRAGIIGEIGVNLHYITAQEERVFRAAARAHRQTGAPIFTHASMYPVGIAQLALLREEGVDPNRVVIGHCDTFLDSDYHAQLLTGGAHLAFDTIGRQHMNPDRRRAQYIVELVREGWIESVLLSSDRCHRSDLDAFGGVGYAHVFSTFLNQLRELGLTQDELDTLTITNPRRILAWS